jgi:hypothetical protein
MGLAAGQKVGERVRVFKLVRMLGLDDVCLGGDCFRLRVEVFQALDEPQCYRAEIWRVETYRMQPTFPQDEVGQPAHDTADENVLVGWGDLVDADLDNIHASDPEAAMKKVLQSLERAIVRTKST